MAPDNSPSMRQETGNPSNARSRLQYHRISMHKLECSLNASQVQNIFERREHGLLLVFPRCLGLARPLRPTRLSCPPERFASFFRADVPPSGGSEPKGLAFYGRRRQLSTCKVEYLQREIDQDFRRETCLPDDPSKRNRATHTQNLLKILAQRRICTLRISHR
jgi:hypothetical protein